MAPVLGYWPIRGLAQPIRFLLEYTNTKYDERLFYNQEEWKPAKESTLGMRFPNLPYYIDGDVRLSESTAILRHLARKNNMAGSTEEELCHLDVVYGMLTDLNMNYALLVYDTNFESKKDEFIKNLDSSIIKCSNAINDGPYILGDKISYVDFFLYELLEKYLFMVPNCLDKFKTLQDFHKNISELESIKKYRASTRFQSIKDYFNGNIAKFGAGKY